jgi:hypothetical protein
MTQLRLEVKSEQELECIQQPLNQRYVLNKALFNRILAQERPERIYEYNGDFICITREKIRDRSEDPKIKIFSREGTCTLIHGCPSHISAVSVVHGIGEDVFLVHVNNGRFKFVCYRHKGRLDQCIWAKSIGVGENIYYLVSTRKDEVMCIKEDEVIWKKKTPGDQYNLKISNILVFYDNLLFIGRSWHDGLWLVGKAENGELNMHEYIYENNPFISRIASELTLDNLV